MISEIVIHVVGEKTVYPFLYGIGWIVVKALSLGRARILPLCEDDATRGRGMIVRRSNQWWWTPAALMFAAIVALFVTGIAIWTYETLR